MGWFQGGQWGGSKTQGWMRAVAAVAGLRPQDVFATSLYTGNGTTQTLTTGFKPDCLWRKARGSATTHTIADSLRGTNSLSSDTDQAEIDYGANAPGLLSTGFNTGAGGATYNNIGNVVAWSLRRAQKFFDVVIYTGDGAASRQISHGLGIAPGMVFAKARNSGATAWGVRHRSATGELFLNATNAQLSSFQYITDADALTFTLTGSAFNTSGTTYVAYVLAHDPDTANGVIQCGGGNSTLPWAPQWVLFRDASANANWFIEDNVRGFATSGTAPSLNPNTSATEATSGALFVSGSALTFNGLTSPIWCAIRAPV